MAIFHHSEHSDGLPSTTGKQRLPVGQSIVVIAGLSALSWVVLIAAIVAIRALV